MRSQVRNFIRLLYVQTVLHMQIDYIYVSKRLGKFQSLYFEVISGSFSYRLSVIVYKFRSAMSEMRQAWF